MTLIYLLTAFLVLGLFVLVPYLRDQEQTKNRKEDNDNSNKNTQKVLNKLSVLESKVEKAVDQKNTFSFGKINPDNIQDPKIQESADKLIEIAEDHYNIANAYFVKTMFSKAIEFYTKEIDKGKYFNKKAYLNRGKAKYFLVTESSQFLRTDLNTKRFKEKRILKRKHELELATKDISTYLNLVPDTPELYQLLELRALMFTRLKKHDKANADLEKAIELEPNNPNTYCNKAINLAKSGEYKESLNLINHAIQLKGDNPTFYNAKGLILSKKENFQGAIENYNIAIDLNNDYLVPLFNKANAKLSLQNFQGAISDFTLILSKNPKDNETLFERGRCYVEMKKTEKAFLDFQSILDNGLVNEDVYKELGSLKFAQNEFSNALNYYEKALLLDSDRDDIWFLKAGTLLELNQLNSAEEIVLSLIKDYPKAGIAYSTHGVIELKKNNNKTALKRFKEAIKLDSNSHNDYKLAGISSFKLGNYEQALMFLNKALEKNENDPYSLEYRGKTYYELNNYPYAIEDFNKIAVSADITENSKIGSHLYFYRGISFLSNSQIKESIQDLNKHLKNFPDDWFAYLMRGKAYCANGKPELGLRDFKSAQNIPEANQKMIKEEMESWDLN